MLVLELPRSMAPKLLIFPAIVLVPLPVNVINASGVVAPMATVLIVPLPAATVKPNALSTVPKVSLPFAELVVIVRSAENTV